MSYAEEEIEIEVPFFDLDPMNVVWHGNYVKYTEIARCKLLEKIGYSYPEMVRDGYVYPIAKMDMKFIKSATLSQKLLIKASLEEYEPSLKIKYEIKDIQSGDVIFKATTMQICVDAVSRKSLYDAPQGLKEGLKCLSIS